MKTNYPKMHVSLYVKNIKETQKFYTAFFGQEPSKTETRYTKYTLEEPALIISFIEDPKKANAYNGHLGIQVESLEEMKERLVTIQAKGLETLEEKQTSCCYALQDKFWVQDPDGTPWEVYYFHEDVKFNDPIYDLNSNEACCTPQSNEKIVAQEINCC